MAEDFYCDSCGSNCCDGTIAELNARLAWQDISTAPKDGTEILVRRDNGCSWEHYVVWWGQNEETYPWVSDGNAYASDRFDDWMPLPPPPPKEPA
jgi:hypothetical protein